MKNEDFELLKKSLEQAIAYANGDTEGCRVTVWKRAPNQVEVKLWLDEDIVQHFKHLAPDAESYGFEINQTLRAAMETPRLPEAEADADAMAERIAEKVVARLASPTKSRAARVRQPA